MGRHPYLGIQRGACCHLSVHYTTPPPPPPSARPSHTRPATRAPTTPFADSMHAADHSNGEMQWLCGAMPQSLLRWSSGWKRGIAEHAIPPTGCYAESSGRIGRAPSRLCWIGKSGTGWEGGGRGARFGYIIFVVHFPCICLEHTSLSTLVCRLGSLCCFTNAPETYLSRRGPCPLCLATSSHSPFTSLDTANLSPTTSLTHPPHHHRQPPYSLPGHP